jgi:hypothetical protein
MLRYFVLAVAAVALLLPLVQAAHAREMTTHQLDQTNRHALDHNLVPAPAVTLNTSPAAALPSVARSCISVLALILFHWWRPCR